MTLPDGVFAASLDADTEGEEGATYTWTADEVRRALEGAGLADAWPLFAEAYDVSEAGNWEGRVILRRVASDVGLAERHGLAAGEVAGLLERARAALLAVRDRRPQPARDDKALAAWNGLAWPPAPTPRRCWRVAATPSSRRLRIATSRSPNGRRIAFSRRCGRPTGGSSGRGRTAGPGTPERSRTRRAWPRGSWRCTRPPATSAGSSPPARPSRRSSLHFADPAGGFHDTADDAERLVARPRSLEDNAVPSGGAMAARCSCGSRRSPATGRYVDAAEAAIGVVGAAAGDLPDGVRAVALRDRLAGRPGRRDRDRRRPRRPADGAPRGRRPRGSRPRRHAGGVPAGAPAASPTASPSTRVASAAGRGDRSGPRGERRAAPPGPLRPARPADRLRLPRLRLPPAGDRARSARRDPGGLTWERRSTGTGGPCGRSRTSRGTSPRTRGCPGRAGTSSSRRRRRRSSTTPPWSACPAPRTSTRRSAASSAWAAPSPTAGATSSTTCAGMRTTRAGGCARPSRWRSSAGATPTCRPCSTRRKAGRPASRLEQRAAAAGTCEPRLLRDPAVVRRVLALLDTITSTLPGRARPAHRRVPDPAPGAGLLLERRRRRRPGRRSAGLRPARPQPRSRRRLGGPGEPQEGAPPEGPGEPAAAVPGEPAPRTRPSEALHSPARLGAARPGATYTAGSSASSNWLL